jgi:hypothetical protein
MTLRDQVERIETREDLTAFIGLLARDYDRDPAGWENGDLVSFLEALSAWVADMPGYFENRGLDSAAVPVWRLVGMMLLAARSYD